MVADGQVSQGVAEKYFPELKEGKESEDEKIRKALIRFHKSTIDVDGIKGKDIIAWLEKQGEQKPVVIIPKFRVGDVIRPKGSTAEYTIESISGECYRGNLWRLPIGCEDDYELVEQNSTWSKEDNYAIERLFCLLDNEQDNYPQLSCDFQEIQEIKKRLKSLKDRYTWKPSELQIEALAIAIRCGIKLGTWEEEALKDLIEQLKKLREE